MTDPLSLLKSFFQAGKKIDVDGDVVRFDKMNFPKNTKSNYLRMGRTQPNKEYYSLESLLFYLPHIQSNYMSYVQKATAEKVQLISFPDTKDLANYFTGAINNSQNIDKTVPLATPHYGTDDMKLSVSKPEHFQTINTIELPLNRKETSISTQDLTNDGDLGKMMSIDEIAHLKMKRLAHKKSAVHDPYAADHEISAELADDHIPIPLTSDVHKRPRITNFNERTAKNRNNILQSNNKDFSNVIPMLNTIRSSDINANQDGSTYSLDAPAKSNLREMNKEAIGNLSYNRYDQERFNTEQETAGFKINTLGSFKGLMTKMETDSPINTNAKPSCLVAKRESRTPIIIVPTAPSSLINLNTVLSLIQDHNFDESAKNSSSAKEGHIFVHRKKDKLINGQLQSVSVPYICIDNTDKLSGSDWNRVVAVFVHGPTWQFKGWPYLLANSCPSEIFSRIQAFHLKYSDSPLDSNISKWNVTVLNILRNRRHIDRAAATSFWDSVDKFISRNKPSLRY